MLILKKGKIYLCDKECESPEALFFTLKDFAETGNHYLISEEEVALNGMKNKILDLTLKDR